MRWTDRRLLGKHANTLLLWFLLVEAIIVGLSVLISQQWRSMSFERESPDVARQVSRQISQMHGLLGTMISSHHATAGDQSTLLAMVEQLRQDNPKITAVGRYQSVPIWKRSAFEEEMAEYGLYDFTISDLSANARLPSPRRAIAKPISLIDPMTPQLLPLLGTDLAAVRTLLPSLSSAILQNSTIAIAIPDYWPAARQLMVLQPAYRGLHAPENPDARIQQADGGYFLIIDPDVYLQGVTDNETGSSLHTLSIMLRKYGEDTLLSRHQYPTENLLAGSWFKPPLQQRVFELGDASLILVIEGSYGIPRTHLIAAASTNLLIIALFIAALSWLEERRRASLEKQQSDKALRDERDRTAHTLHLISDAVITVNCKCIIQHVNTIGTQFLGFSLSALINRPLDDFLSLSYRNPPSGKFNARRLLQDMRPGQSVALDLCTDISADESNPRVFRSSISLNERSTEKQATAVFLFRDTSAEVELTEALEYQANHDTLTGCANRYYFERYLDNLISNKRDDSAGSALLYIDLDQFKVVNDTAGHAAGDMMLVHLNEQLSQIINSGDMLARLGGDEFGLLMNNVNTMQAEHMAQSVHTLFQTMAFNYQNRGFPIRASLGLVHFDEAGSSASEVLAAADMACYAAKDLGRNQLYVYHAGDAAITLRTSELEWLSLLREAMEHKRFRLYVQPLGFIKERGRFNRYEILLRLAGEAGQEFSASSIICAAERYGMMRDIDRWVIEESLSIIAEIDNDKKNESITFAINLSGQSAADSTLSDYIRDRILHHHINPKCLCFEITETAAISHFANAVALSHAIRNMGAQIALDDFGAGLSSFAYLKSLPIDILKIDGQFIKDIAGNPVDQAMVKAIHDVARSMQITTVAECVESSAALDVLTEIGINFAQGYYIGKPVPIETLLSSEDIDPDLKGDRNNRLALS